MTPEQIADLALLGESETVEFKETTGTRREAAQTLCAFLNQGGGRVLFGVTPAGVAKGQQIAERTIEELGTECRRINPPVFPTIERIPLDGTRDVIVVSVDRGPLRPYTYRGDAYGRVGNTTQVLSADQYQRMLFERLHSEQRWENQLATGWSVDDLDLTEVRRTVTEALRFGRLVETPGTEPLDMLTGLGLLQDGVLLRAAAVLFGKTDRLHSAMPQCLLRVARFRGKHKIDFHDNRQFNGNAFVLLANAERFLLDTLPIAGRFESDRIQRIDEPLYPIMATREAIANALCHRDYSIGGGSIGVAVYDDRLEISSSGPLPFGLTPEKLFAPHRSQPWNPLIARTFYRRGIIEEWGSGTLKMAEAVRDAGLPDLEIEDSTGEVIVRFRHDRSLRPPPVYGASSPRQRRDLILHLLDGAADGLTRPEIRARLGPEVSDRQVRRTLEELQAAGLIVSPGPRSNRSWKRV